jgi:uncharacterized protein
MLYILLGLVALVGAVAFIPGCADSLIFHPAPNDAQLRRQYEPLRVDIASHGATVEGWWVENPAAVHDSVILYFGGNAEDVLYMAGTISRFDARRMLVVNYRGYGESTGKPGQRALYDDGLAVYEYALKSGVRADQIVVMGRSLGSGVASMVAGSKPVRAAILITPYDSLAAVAAEHFPKVAVSLLLRHPFPSTDWARKAHAPALMLAAEHDTIIPSDRARRLAEAWAGEARFQVLPNTGHNDIQLSPDFYRSINDFLATVSGKPKAGADTASVAAARTSARG